MALKRTVQKIKMEWRDLSKLGSTLHKFCGRIHEEYTLESFREMCSLSILFPTLLLLPYYYP